MVPAWVESNLSEVLMTVDYKGAKVTEVGTSVILIFFAEENSTVTFYKGSFNRLMR